MIHVDVMDGHFVPNITMGPDFVRSVRRVTDLPIDAHLMVTHPQNYIEDFKKAGADKISIHVEIENVETSIGFIKKLKVSPGLALNPQTPIEKVIPYLDQVDFILVMSVHPGFGGQKFIEKTFEKVSELRSILNTKKLDLDIAVDGGVNVQNMQKLKDVGVTVFVVGNAIFKSKNYKQSISEMRKLL